MFLISGISFAVSSNCYLSDYCKDAIVRKEWRTLTNKQKKNYIEAVHCLHKKPAKAKSLAAGAVSRFDDFQGIHSKQTPSIHWVGHFAHWHRLMVAEYEEVIHAVLQM